MKAFKKGRINKDIFCCCKNKNPFIKGVYNDGRKFVRGFVRRAK